MDATSAGRTRAGVPQRGASQHAGASARAGQTRRGAAVRPDATGRRPASRPTQGQRPVVRMPDDSTAMRPQIPTRTYVKRMNPSRPRPERVAAQAERPAGDSRRPARGYAADVTQGRVGSTGARGYRSAVPRHAAPEQRKHRAGKVILVLVVILALAGVGIYVLRDRLGITSLIRSSQIEPGQEVTITIPEGSGGSTIVKQLMDAGVISDSSSFLQAVQKQNADQKLKSGTYVFLTGSDPDEVVTQLVEGPNSTQNQLKLAEGLTVQKTAEQVESCLGISADDFLAQAKASNYVSDYPFLAAAQNDSLEGFLYGKTYDLTGKDQTSDAVIRTMLDQYSQEVQSLDLTTAEANIKQRYGVQMSDYDILIMASIIEKEALTDDDRYKIASVFYNRLQQGMALQSDATMGYVTGGDVTADDLKTQSPYNTYLNKGLPPTPICSPSLASIQAAMSPADTDYLYFWIDSQNHIFSETYEQHQQAIASATSQSTAASSGNSSSAAEG
ncbi:MAG: endolytic transglycosylase MltG [Atopobiaceae bacterium]